MKWAALIRLAMLLGIPLVTSACKPSSEPAITVPIQPNPNRWEPDDTQLGMYQSLCYYRESAGVAPQRLDEGLCEIAMQWARHMAATQKLHHSGVRAAENIAFGTRTPRETFCRWSKSTDHRTNMLATHQLIGLGHAKDKAGRMWWCYIASAPASPDAGSDSTGAIGNGNNEETPEAR